MADDSHSPPAMAPSLNMPRNRPASSRSIGDDFPPATPSMRSTGHPHTALHHAGQHYAPYAPPPSSHVTLPPVHSAHPPHLRSVPLLSPSQAAYSSPVPTPPNDHGRTPQVHPSFTLPSISAAVRVPSLPAPPAAGPSDADLSQISCAQLDLRDEEPDFVMSPELQDALRHAQPTGAASLHARVFKEATAYADDRKGLVRDALKHQQRNANVPLSPIDKGKLGSRREAKVHRVKERCFEKALKDSIRWLVNERVRDNLAKQSSSLIQQVPAESQYLLQHDSQPSPLLQSELQPLRHAGSQPQPQQCHDIRQQHQQSHSRHPHPHEDTPHTSYGRRPQ